MFFLTELFNRLFPPTPIPPGPWKTDEEIKAEAEGPQLPSNEWLEKRRRQNDERNRKYAEPTFSQDPTSQANKTGWDFDKLP